MAFNTTASRVVKTYSPAKTIVDLLRSGKQQKAFHDSNTGFAHATEAMKDALKLRKATLSEIAKYAIDAASGKKPFSRALRR
ncbi:hypothetical protein IVA98_00450 [Bradyrhizobium sp. 160]|uniref:hypothetical protein n=1 Tax=Bradyrhizobium sp. 160 TaxID=2782634 RepID=UPI001FF7CE06|nr:hypothetical protein [Bradyrhizobium sp. 160]MCK1621755.1 hypothetical protein [Bradyrhizobium sp. 160]